MKLNLLLLDSYVSMESLISFAFSFSHRSRRRLKILYVYDIEWIRQNYTAGAATMADPGLADIQSEAINDYKGAASKIRGIVTDYLKGHSVDVPFETEITETNRIDLVRRETEKQGSDVLLLIGNMEHYSENIGGVLAYPDLVTQSRCPVLIIPADMQYTMMRKIVYLTGFHYDDLEILRNLPGLLQSDDLEITVLHNEADFGFEEKLKWIGFVELAKSITGNDSLIPVLKQEKKVREALQDFIEKNEVDIIGILKEKKGFFEEIFSTSETKKVLKHFGKPVLVYHEN